MNWKVVMVVVQLLQWHIHGMYVDSTDTKSFPDGAPPGVWHSSVAVADVNMDGLVDFLFTGQAPSGIITRLYVQISPGVFLDATAAMFPGGVPPDVALSSVAFADVNNDTRPDFLLTGQSVLSRITRLYVQSSPGVFEDATNATSFPSGVPPGVRSSSVAFADVNNDGLPDFLLSGYEGPNKFVTRLYVQSSPGVFLNATDATSFPGGVPPGVTGSSVAFADVNKDGLLDFLLTGEETESFAPSTRLYVQGSPGVFEDATNATSFPGGVPPGVHSSSVAFADVNNDGLPDFLLSGGTGSAYVTLLYVQSSPGVFQDATSTFFPGGMPPGVYHSSVAFADFNSDGRQDLLLTGSMRHGLVTILYLDGCPAGQYYDGPTCAVCSGHVLNHQTECVASALDSDGNSDSFDSLAAIGGAVGGLLGGLGLLGIVAIVVVGLHCCCLLVAVVVCALVLATAWLCAGITCASLILARCSCSTETSAAS